LILAWLWVALGVVFYPLVVLLAWAHPRLREHARERLGLVTPEVEPGALWMHAASLGEGKIVEAVAPVLPLPVVRTCTSDTARPQDTGVAWTTCLPLDSWPCVTAWLDRVRPRALLLVEAEFWPALLLACRARGIPVTLLAPREASGVARLSRLPGLLSYLRRGMAVVVPGDDLKRQPARRAPTFTWSGDALLCGSTHAGEERALVEAWWSLPQRPLLVLAPRDPRRFEAVAGQLAELAARGFRLARRSQFGPRVPEGSEVVLLDTIGELSTLYGAARAAYVGGTLFPGVGGHSPAEPLAAGLPVVRGPCVEANAVAWEGVDAVVATESTLATSLVTALHRQRATVGASPALAEVVAALSPALAAPVPPERPLRPWLWPLVPVWMAGALLRPRPLKKASIPVISVGALSAGGSGKTPVAAWIAARVHGSVVVSRGYGRRKGADIRMSGEATDLGDELAMLARRGQAVCSAPDRVAGIETAAKAGARVAVLDDGLQYGAVGRDIEVLVIDARWPDGGGPIPVGTRRVPRSWIGKADVIWSNHGPLPGWVASLARRDAIIVEGRYRPVGWRRRGELLPLSAIPARPAIALAGIARPDGFFRQLRQLGVRVERTMVFADHHAFTWHDLQAIEAWTDDHLVVTTEKDAARLPADARAWALVVEVELASGEAALRERLEAL